MTAPTVEAVINDLMDRAWNVVYDLLSERGLLRDGRTSRRTPGSIPGWTVVHSRTLAVQFVDTRPVDAIVFHHDLLGADDPKAFFTVPG
ncbi:hypothetical protein QFZ23_002410 [Arthrobacter globiformis]|uniref:hypothetical protein n=1 Tax=Arthrobacter globiformis TaxID=1665 RepID=UPI00277D9995|nr:hypothetical protein [Arthrobacter globiformis]MDQ1058509.1 hypothetical protein [Arthrobacter globiformis]